MIAVVMPPVAAVADVDVAAAVNRYPDRVIKSVIARAAVPSLAEFGDFLTAGVVFDDVRGLAVHNPDVAAAICSDVGDADERRASVVGHAGFAYCLHVSPCVIKANRSAAQVIPDPDRVGYGADALNKVKVVVAGQEGFLRHAERLHVAEAQPRLAEREAGGLGVECAHLAVRLLHIECRLRPKRRSLPCGHVGWP